MQGGLVEIEVPSHSWVIGKTVVDLKLPKGTLIVLIQRQGKAFVLSSGTEIEAQDNLLVFADKDSLKKIQELVEVFRVAFED